MDFPSRFSPDQGRVQMLRRTGRCVTARHDLTKAGGQAVPVLVEAQEPRQEISKIPPNDDSMHDG